MRPGKTWMAATSTAMTRGAQRSIFPLPGIRPANVEPDSPVSWPAKAAKAGHDTSFLDAARKDMDGRDKHGHDTWGTAVNLSADWYKSPVRAAGPRCIPAPAPPLLTS